MEVSQASSALVRDSINEGIAVQQQLLDGFVPQVVQLAQQVVETFEQGGRLFFLGNGGSAAEAQHIVTELVVRFKQTRRALPAMALTADTSVLTATGNDFDFSQVFARQVEALVESRDMVVAFSTSGTAMQADQIIISPPRSTSSNSVSPSFNTSRPCNTASRPRKINEAAAPTTNHPHHFMAFSSVSVRQRDVTLPTDREPGEKRWASSCLV